MTLIVQPPGPGVPNYSQADTPGYGAYAQPFSATEEKLPPKSFSMDVLIDPRRFAAGRETTLRWAFDMRPSISGKPWGMVFNFFGNHEGAVVPGAFKAVPIEGLKRLDTAWDFDLSIGQGDASVLSDTFLKNAKGESVLEFGVFPRPSAAALGWATSKGKLLGSFTSDGVTWTVYVVAGYVMAFPSSPQPRHNFNMLALRDFTKAKGILPAGAMFVSTATGIEPAMGDGQCRMSMAVNAA